MKRTIAAVLAGLAIVAGGFFAGTFSATDTAVAQEADAVATTPVDPAGAGPQLHGDHDRGPRGHLLEAAADYLGMDPAAVVEALANGSTLADLTTHVDGLIEAIVDSATTQIDEAVADGRMTEERAVELKDGLEEHVTTFVNSSHERPDGPLADRHVRGFIKEAADVIGIPVTDLVEGLANGKSIAEVAEENGMSEGSLVAHLTNAARDRIEIAVNRTR